MIIKNSIIEEIKQYSKLNNQCEVCGFIVESNQEHFFIPVENKHPNKEAYFLIYPKDYLDIKNKHKIIYFFHSHIDNNNFTDLDKMHQKYHNIDMLMYNLKTDELKEMKCK